MPDDFDHCEALVREADKDRFVATLFAAAPRRRALYALYAFNAELTRVRHLAREPMPGEIRLQWWREVLGGTRTGEAGPVASALMATIIRYRLPLKVFEAMIEARSFDLYDDPIGSRAELEGYAEKTSSALIGLAAQILNEGNDPRIRQAVHHAGIAQAIVALLVAFPLHAGRRQLYLPLDVLQRHGARTEDVFAGIATPQLKAALAELREIARSHLAQAPVAEISPRLMAAFLPVALVAPTLKRLEQIADAPFAARPLPQWRRQWLIWRAARNPRRIIGN
ncbi:MAG: squalene/phytoene synthase family protein [Xanthobacteraceae bacterium]|nr:squalene/phytoene synthase family protein [Xanthobacteraceae bacterium]